MSNKLSKKETYTDRLKDSLYWWLGKKRPFYANDDYKIELLHIDREHYSVKIRVTNLKTNTVVLDSLENSNERG